MASVILSGSHAILPASTVIVQNGEITIDDTSVNATLKKDSDSQLREIQFTDITVVTGEDAGVTVTIPQDTKVFAPVSVKDDSPTLDTSSQAAPLLTGDKVVSTDTAVNTDTIVNAESDTLSSELPVPSTGEKPNDFIIVAPSLDLSSGDTMIS